MEQLSLDTFQKGKLSTGCLLGLSRAAQLVAEFCLKCSICILASHKNDTLNLLRVFVCIISLAQPNHPVGGRVCSKTEDQKKIEKALELPFLEYLLRAVCMLSQKIRSFEGRDHLPVLKMGRLNHGQVGNVPQATQLVEGRLEIHTKCWSPEAGPFILSRQTTPTPWPLPVHAL